MATSYEGVKAEGSDFIKPDPETTANPTSLEEVDEFEDTGELELPAQIQQAWLVRLPPNLHEKWSAVDTDGDLVIGTVRRYKKTGKHQILLNRSLPMYEKIAKSFDMDQTDGKVINTYVFSEKDLPGYRKGSKNKQGGQGGVANGRVDKNHRYQFRRAVPKQTALKYLITNEYNCMATANAETAELMRQRVQAAEHVRPKVEFMTMDPRQSEGMSLNASREHNFDNFVKAASSKTKPQENKAARMPRNELLDRLFACFKEYTFWSMKALRERLHQPELYLKENLDAIAELIRSGPNTGTYRLKNEAVRDNFKQDDGGDESDPEMLLDSDDDDARDDGNGND